MLTLIPADEPPCSCCGAPALLVDDRHGPLCLDCFETLMEIQNLGLGSRED